MSAVVSVSTNEGVAMKKEREDPEVVEIKENNRKNEVTPKQKKAGKKVHLLSTEVSHFNKAEKNVNLVKLTQNGEDSESVKGRFVWKIVESYSIRKGYLPCLIRIINDEPIELVSVRIVENLLHGTDMSSLHTDIYKCVSIDSYLMLNSEATLLNDINKNYTIDQAFGKDPFIGDKEFLVSMTDVTKFFKFLEVCYHKLKCIFVHGIENCGFIRISSASVVPYCLKDDQKYVPLFFFEGDTDNLKKKAITLKNWNLAYMKFCCTVQGIRNELFASDSCSVISLEDIIAHFPSNTHFEEYWPTKVVDYSQLLSMENSIAFLGNSGSWIKAPPPSKLSNILIPENNKNTMQAPGGPVAPPENIPMANSSYQNGWPPNEMGFMVQDQSGVSMNNSHVPPLPLIQAENVSTSDTSNTTYRNVTSMNQPITPVYSQITNSSVITHSTQLRQLYAAQRPSNGVDQQQLQHLNVPPIQQYNGPSLSSLNGSNSRYANTQQCNTVRNITAPATEIIDLTSPPSSPAPTTIPETNVHNRAAWKLIRRPKRKVRRYDTRNNVAYQIQKATLQGKTIHCINAKEYIHNADLMVSIKDVVMTVMPSSTVSKCVQILQKYFNISVYCGNYEQITILHKNGGHLRSLIPDDFPLIMLQDVTHVLPQLEAMSKHDVQVQPRNNNHGKRQRIC